MTYQGGVGLGFQQEIRPMSDHPEQLGALGKDSEIITQRCRLDTRSVRAAPVTPRSLGQMPGISLGLRSRSTPLSPFVNSSLSAFVVRGGKYVSVGRSASGGSPLHRFSFRAGSCA